MGETDLCDTCRNRQEIKYKLEGSAYHEESSLLTDRRCRKGLPHGFRSRVLECTEFEGHPPLQIHVTTFDWIHWWIGFGPQSHLAVQFYSNPEDAIKAVQKEIRKGLDEQAKKKK